VVDPGDSIPILNWIMENNKFLKGILITHSHFDHIYGINDLCAAFPNVEIFASKHAKEGMLSAKLNRSYYAEIPFVVKCSNINVLEECDKVLLLENIFVNVINTPGHNNDCISFQIGKHLFTGDALIPGIKVYTKSKYGNKIHAENSIQKLITKFDDDTMIWPGHDSNCSLGELKQNLIY